MKAFALIISTIALVLGLVIFSLSDDIPPIDSQSLRAIESGDLVGFEDSFDTHAWLGIPFAKSPIGDLRWRAPQPEDSWQGVLEANQYANACLQFSGSLAGPSAWFSDYAGDEDCLYLNIWAPKWSASEVPTGDDRLPVMVWVHGGANVIGTANTYPGDRLAGQQNVILVALNYRLGFFGWFSHEALIESAETAEDASGNFGTLDIVQALKWVQQNISAFGGDPNNVTLFGESAGGRNTFSLVGSPLAKGLFHKAIVQSGTTGTIDMETAQNLQEQSPTGHQFSSKELIRQLGLESAVSNLGSDSKAIARLLREIAAKDLMAPALESSSAYGTFSAPQVLADGYVLPKEPLINVFTDPSKINAVPIIAGTNRDEMKTFTTTNEDLVDTRFGIFREIKDLETYNRMTGYFSDNWKAGGVDMPLDALLISNNNPMFAYRFDWDEAPDSMFGNMSDLLGAGHGLELDFVFGDVEDGLLSPIISSEENYPGMRTLSDQMMSYWANFAYTGNPGKGRNNDLPEWNAWGSQPEQLMVLDTAADGGLRMSDEKIVISDIKQQLLNDQEHYFQEQLCELYTQLFYIALDRFHSRDAFSEEEYENFGTEGCSQYPYTMFLEG